MIQALAFNHGEQISDIWTEYRRILSAAVINSHIRQMLLNDSVKAISNGYGSEQFNINSEEKVRLSTIRATSLADFAAQLAQV